uniref:Gypsy retrotransposon integrase-like protein 1 n=1 Tax=Xenopus tropicalis TaxID=8364 RepID=A0A803K5R9_XENTR
MDRRGNYLMSNNKIFVPEDLRLEVLRFVHDHPVSGHLGVRKTLELANRNFFWPGMSRDCMKYVTSCQTCARFKDTHSRPMGLLQPLPVPEKPWERISMDFIVELPKSGGFNTIMVVVDGFTKMAHFIPLVGLPSAATTAEVFIKEVFRLHGLPREIVSDRGSQFTSRFWRALCQGLHIELALSSAFHPQTNGQTERTNQTLEQYIRCFSSYSQEDWSALLPLAEFSYNNAVHSSSKQTPFFANYGFHITTLPGLAEVTVPAAQDRLSFLKHNFELLQQTLREAQRNYKGYADKRRRKSPEFKLGDLVWLSTRNLRLSCPSKKLGQRFMGPFPILEQINSVTFKLKLPTNLRIHPVFHVSLLKKVVENPFPGRIGAPPEPVTVQGVEEFEVQAILDSRYRRGRLQYLVQWKGYTPEDNSWESSTNVHAPQLIRAFHKKFPGKPASGRIRRPRLGRGQCQVPGRSPKVGARPIASARSDGRACSVARARIDAGVRRDAR